MGIGLSADFQLRPAPAAATPSAGAPKSFPCVPNLMRGVDQPTVIMFLHPFCPCSRASLAELERLLPNSGREFRAYVLFYVSPHFREQVQDTPLWKQAASIPKVTVLRDEDGCVARIFGALISGSVVVYNAEGELAFAGGITPDRGDIGKNAGADAVSLCMAGDRPLCNSHSVYGCPILNLPSRRQESADESK